MPSDTRLENGKPVSTFARRRTRNTRAPLLGIGNVFMRTVMRAIARFDIRGIEHVPMHGPVLVMINHTNFWDPVLVMPFLRRPMVPMTKVEGFENRWFGWMIAGYGAIPVHRGMVDREAIRSATDVLEGGGMLLIAPEGTRSRTGQLMKGQEGMAFIAARAKVPLQILPVAVLNAKDMIPSIKRLRRATLHVRIGAPFALPASTGKPDLAAITDFCMRKLADIMPPELRGVYAEEHGRPGQSN
jgi:1-acyl-sn-glycerol-3-phosphate acyltransferase